MQTITYKVSLYTSPAHIPFSLFTHPWFVIRKNGVPSRYEVRYKRNTKNKQLGYIHIDELPSYSGIEVFSFLRKPVWNATLLGSIEGGENSPAHTMYEFIENSPNTYNNKMNYFLFGPNSNTYAQWILDNNPTFPTQLKWNALGKNYKNHS